MAARYRKVDPRFWKDEKVRRMAPEEKLVAVYGFTAQSNRIGCFTFSPAMAAEDLGMKPETFAKRFEKVCQTLAWGWDSISQVLYLPTWWKYNQPENHNNMIGNLKDLEDVPGSPLVAAFCANTEYLQNGLSKTFTQTLAERYPKRLASQEQEQEQEQEPEQEQEQVGAAAPPAVALLTFPTRGKVSEWGLQEEMLSGWSRLYPGVDVFSECRKALAWCHANPKKTKTADGMPAFLVNWLNRGVNSGTATKTGSGKAQSNLAGLDADRIAKYSTGGTVIDNSELE